MKYVAVLSSVLCFVVLAFAAAAGIGVVVDARPAIAQCAMCGEAVESASEADGGSLARGFYWSILFMLFVVLSLGAGLVSFITRAVRAHDVANVVEAGDADETGGVPREGSL